MADRTTVAVSVVQDVWRFCTWRGVRLRNKTRLVGEHVPYVDITIVSCGEDIDTILDTVRAACVQDYTSSKLRVLVGDDGNDDKLEAALTALRRDVSCELLYHRRPGRAGSKKGYKAGNMNAALAYLDSITDDHKVEFCAFLDCDMIIEPEFLRACLGHLLRNPSAGVAIVPQSFYNIPQNDPLYQSMHVHNYLDQVQRDTLDAAWETGPGVVFRRQAIADIGGFDEWVLMEDIIAGMLLNGLSWQTVYCHEQLQWGLVPETLAAHIAQRQKWVSLQLTIRMRLLADRVPQVVGTVRGAMIARFGFNMTRLPMLAWRQRVVQLCYCMGPFASVTQKTILNLAFLALVSTGRPLIKASSSRHLNLMLHIALLTGLCRFVESFVSGMHYGHYMIRRRYRSGAWLSPYLLLTISRELLPRRLAGLPMRFVPTARLNSSLLERDCKLRAPIWYRLSSVTLQQGLWYHLLVVTLASSLAYRDYQSSRARPSHDLMCQHMWTHALSPGGDWLIYMDLLAPMLYALRPPTVPARRDLLERSRRGGLDVWYPKKSSRNEEWHWSYMFEELPSVVAFVIWLFLRARVCTLS